MKIIPAIDIFDGRTVRLLEGDYNKVSYYPADPLDQAKIYESFGFANLHIVDLAGSKNGTISVFKTIEKIKASTSLRIEFGGGIRSIKNVEDAYSAGVDDVIIGSLSVAEPDVFRSIITRFGTEGIIVASDVKDKMIAIKGWTEKSSLSLSQHIEMCRQLGIEKFLCTDISRDGKLTGTNIQLYMEVMEEFPGIKLIASGGIKDIEDIRNAGRANVYAVVIGKAIYENKIDLKELAELGK